MGAKMEGKSEIYSPPTFDEKIKTEKTHTKY
jgi:hypothetical protein